MRELIITERSNIVTVANAVRNRTGETEQMTLGEMVGDIGVITNEVSLQDKTVTPTKGEQTIRADNGYDGLNDVTVNAIPNEYIVTIDATATASDVLSGKTAYVNGEKITGTIATRTSSNLTASGATVTVPAGYYASNATKSVDTTTRADTTISVSADDTNDKLTITASNNQSTGYVTGSNKTASKTISLTASGATVTASDGSTGISKSVNTVTQAMPSISVDSSGLITVSATQTAGYVAAGTKSSTQQLDTQPQATITPKNFAQYAVSAGKYTTGDVIVLGDSDLLAGNIKKGVDIFGVVGTYEGSGGGDTSVLDSLIDRTVASYTNDRVTSIGSYAFYSYSNLTSVSFPAVATIGEGAFRYCSNLTSVSFPVVTSIGNFAFNNCTSLTSVSFPAVATIGQDAFVNCNKLTSVSFPVITSIGNFAFSGCNKLTSVSFPVAISIGNCAFSGCTNLTSVSFPVAISIGSYAFNKCTSLVSVSFPKVTNIAPSAFLTCFSLTSASFPAVTNIGSSAFYACRNLKSLYLTGSSVCKLSHSNAFYSTPIGGYSASAGTYGSIYVPTSLLASYKTATNWTYFSSRFVGL